MSGGLTSFPAMRAPAEPHDEPLRPLQAAELARGGRPTGWFDAHTHIGHDDPDGYEADPEEIVAGLDRAGHERALLFAMHEPTGYRAANDRVLDAARDSGGRLVALARVDPHKGPAEAERMLRAGAAGLKLHPRSDRFALDHRGVAQVVALAHEVRGPVIVHAGRGIPHLGEDAVALARRFPGAAIVLAHAGISDLTWLDRPAAALPNLLFDTSWWQVDDLLALLATVPPGRLLYGSDLPYGSGVFGALSLLRCARAVGLGDEAVAMVAGGQLSRILDGQEPADLGPAPGPPREEPHPHHRRVAAWLTAAVQLAFRGADADEALALAGLACRHGRVDPVLDACAELIGIAQEALVARHASEAHGSRPDAVVWPALGAHVLAGTGGLGLDRV